MKMILKGIIPEEIRIQCAKECGFVFQSFHNGEVTNLIEITASSIKLNGEKDPAPELLGLALIQWRNSVEQVMKHKK